MIVIDIAEKPYVFKMFDKLGIPYCKEELRFPAKCEKFPLRWENGDLTCVDEETAKMMSNFDSIVGCEIDHMECTQCENKSVRIGDFTNEIHGFIAERKRVDDFYSSMVDGRLYDQARKMYQWFDGLKIVILEGMDGMVYLEDSHSPFDKIERDMAKEACKSPLQQLFEFRPDKKEWMLGMIADLASCDVALIQSWNLKETAMIIKQLSKGAGIDPKVRSIPKKIAGLTTEEQMLCVIPGIGKTNAQLIINKYGSFGKMISEIRKMPKKEAEKRSMTRKLKEVFG